MASVLHSATRVLFRGWVENVDALCPFLVQSQQEPLGTGPVSELVHSGTRGSGLNYARLE